MVFHRPQRIPKSGPRRGLRLALPLGLMLWSSVSPWPQPAQTPGKATDTKKPNPYDLQKTVGLSERMGFNIPLDLEFSDAHGKKHPLKSFFDDGLPVIVVPVYYKCPKLCSLILAGVEDLVNEQSLTLGKDYKILAVTINPEETPDLAWKKANLHFKNLKDGQFRTDSALAYKWKKHPEGKSANIALPKLALHEYWGFFTGSAENIRRLMDSIGFKYRKVGEEFEHTSAISFITPGGKISSYLYGVTFPERDVRLALTEASEGRIGGIVEQVLLFCFTYDVKSGKYTPYIWNIVRAFSVLVLLVLTIFVLRLRRRNNVAKDGGAEN